MQRQDFGFALSGVALPQVDSTRFLGTQVDSRLDFAEHIDWVCTRLGSSYYALLNLKNVISEDALLGVYYSLAHSVLAYNIMVWGQAAQVRRVLVCQKRIIRLMFGLQRLQSCRDVFKERKILTVTSVFILKLLAYIHTHRNDYQKNSNFHNHDTRSKNCIRLDKIHHLAHRSTPVYLGCMLFNSLPPQLCGMSSSAFKRNLRKMLLDNVFYTIGEFTDYLNKL